MLGRAGQVIPLAPPLCITREEVDEAVLRLSKVLTTIGAELGVA
jgi:4-aminobutyrate aminotransferase-like enzyme